MSGATLPYSDRFLQRPEENRVHQAVQTFHYPRHIGDIRHTPSLSATLQHSAAANRFFQ